MKVSIPVAPGVRYSISAGRRHRRRNSGGGPGLAWLIGGILVIGAIALFTVVSLILGSLVLIGYGIYLGVLARQRGSLRTAEPPTIPIPIPDLTQGHAPIAPPPASPVAGRTVFGLEPSYGLSGAYVLVGLVMFIGGVAVVGSANASQNPPVSATRGPLPSTILPTATPSPTANQEPAVAAPVLPASPTPTTTAARQAAPRTSAQQVAPPSESTTVRPQPAAPQQGSNNNWQQGNTNSTVYYKNCQAARDAGAAPIKRGQPGYRSQLDGDNDGTACEKD